MPVFYNFSNNKLTIKKEMLKTVVTDDRKDDNSITAKIEHPFSLPTLPSSEKTENETSYNNKKIIKKKIHPTKKHLQFQRPLFYNYQWNEEDNNKSYKNKVSIFDKVEEIKFKILPGKIIYIQNSLNIYSSVYNVQSLRYDGLNFNSVDEGYQYYKLIDLCKSESLKRQFYKKRDNRERRIFVRKTLSRNKKTKKDIVKWREEKGMLKLYDLTLQKFLQNPDLLDQMREEKDKLILNCYGEDNYDGCGKIVKLQKWLDENIDREVNIPCSGNLNDLKILPTISTGKNLQGIVVMLVRRHIEKRGWL